MANALEGASTKEEVLEMIRRLPDDCTVSQVMYHLAVRRGIEESLKEIDEGRVFTQDEVERLSREWLKSSGPEQP